MIDFFNSTCSEEPRRDALFGLCDDENNSEKAYSSVDLKDQWIATIDNKRQITVLFTAIDHCLNIRKANSNDLESTCDGMLTFEESLYLVELKNQRADWISEAIGQLENTIKQLHKYNEIDLQRFKFKKAFASNKKKTVFRVIESEQKKRFYTKTGGFRLDVQGRIVIQ